MAFVTITPVARNGYANTIVRNINPFDILEVVDASETEILEFPTALSKTVVNYISYNQPATLTLLSATSTAAMLSAVSAAQSGILGGGASR